VNDREVGDECPQHPQNEFQLAIVDVLCTDVDQLDPVVRYISARVGDGDERLHEEVQRTAKRGVRTRRRAMDSQERSEDECVVKLTRALPKWHTADAEFDRHHHHAASGQLAMASLCQPLPILDQHGQP
jgi:hypothetical protein